MPEVTVTLRGGKISVDQSVVQASEGNKQKVRWTSTDGPFEIVFKDGSDWPNPPAVREDKGVWSTEAGPFTKHGRKLSYAVKASGFPTLDPDIEIIP